MPQMMPINWLILFFMFLLIFILFNIMNYYNYNINSSNMKLNLYKTMKNFNWKW